LYAASIHTHTHTHKQTHTHTPLINPQQTDATLQIWTFVINEQVARLPSYSFSTLHGFTWQICDAGSTYLFPCDVKHDLQNSPHPPCFSFVQFVPCTVPCHRMQPQSKCVNMLLEYVVEGERYLIVRGKYTHTHTHTRTHNTQHPAAHRRPALDLAVNKLLWCAPHYTHLLITAPLVTWQYRFAGYFPPWSLQFPLAM
jgi:hypothetical protein